MSLEENTLNIYALENTQCFSVSRTALEGSMFFKALLECDTSIQEYHTRIPSSELQILVSYLQTPVFSNVPVRLSNVISLIYWSDYLQIEPLNTQLCKWLYDHLDELMIPNTPHSEESTRMLHYYLWGDDD